MLSGCPVISLLNEHFQKPLSSIELKGLGYTYGDSEKQRVNALKTISQLRTLYLELLNGSRKEVIQLVEKTSVFQANVTADFK
jgi:hypothetical protein